MRSEKKNYHELVLDSFFESSVNSCIYKYINFYDFDKDEKKK